MCCVRDEHAGERLGGGRLKLEGLALSETIEVTKEAGGVAAVGDETTMDVGGELDERSGRRADAVPAVELTEPDTVGNRGWDQRGDLRVATHDERER